jgi:hypothetical protein
MAYSANVLITPDQARTPHRQVVPHAASANIRSSVPRWLGRAKQSGSLGFGQTQAAHQQPDSARAWGLFESALQITDAPLAQPTSLGELILGQANGQTVSS